MGLGSWVLGPTFRLEAWPVYGVLPQMQNHTRHWEDMVVNVVKWKTDNKEEETQGSTGPVRSGHAGGGTRSSRSDRPTQSKSRK